LPPIESIALVEPAAAGIHIFSRAGLPRLGCLLLGTIALDLGYRVSVQVEEIRPIDRELLLAADLVGISTITPTAARCYELADELRAAGKRVVLGGPHVTWQADEGLQHAPLVMRGESETGFPLLLEQLGKDAPDLASVPGLSWQDDDGVTHHNELSAPVDLDDLPLPDLELAGYGRNKAMGPRRVIPVQTSRGCPFACTFCTVHSTFGRAMRYRSTERVLADLDRIDANDVHVFFYDDNFVVSRSRATELAQGMIDRDYGLKYSAQVRADLGKDAELLALMKRSGCMGVYIGLESVNEAALKNMQKKQTLESMKENVLRIRAAGINVHGMFVLGFDEDDDATVEATIQFAIACGITSVQFMVLTPLPGSEIFSQLQDEGRLRSTDWGLYDAHHVVFEPKLLTPAALQAGQLDGHRRFYSPGRILKNAATGDLLNSAIAVYARKLNKDWRKRNRHYLTAIEGLDVCSSDEAWAAALSSTGGLAGDVPSRGYHR